MPCQRAHAQPGGVPFNRRRPVLWHRFEGSAVHFALCFCSRQSGLRARDNQVPLHFRHCGHCGQCGQHQLAGRRGQFHLTKLKHDGLNVQRSSDLMVASTSGASPKPVQLRYRPGVFRPGLAQHLNYCAATNLKIVHFLKPKFSSHRKMSNLNWRTMYGTRAFRISKKQ